MKMRGSQGATEPIIACPNCNASIPLTESLAAPLVQATQAKYERQLAEQAARIASREATVREQQAQLAKARAAIEEEVVVRLKVERDQIVTEEAEKARLLSAADLAQKAREVANLRQVLRDRDLKLGEAQKAQSDLLRKQREIEDAKREIELTIEKRVQASQAIIRDRARQECEEQLKLKLLEREQQIASMQREIENLRRKAEQGSQQAHGEVVELRLETLLRSKFPMDLIEPVPKGEFGGDVLQRVVGPNGQCCGSIIWETKRTKHWSDGWLAKLRDDQRAAKADLALIVTQALPRGLESFDHIDGVWVAEFRCAIPVAIALRQSLIELSAARQAHAGQQTNMGLIYDYLTGPRFRHRIEAIVEKVSDMQVDLERERKAMLRLWAKRDEQIRGLVESTVGMYGDLQGIAGSTLKQIDGLELPLLGSSSPRAN
jgi:hypothetical protein